MVLYHDLFTCTIDNHPPILFLHSSDTLSFLTSYCRATRSIAFGFPFPFCTTTPPSQAWPAYYRCPAARLRATYYAYLGIFDAVSSSLGLRQWLARLYLSFTAIFRRDTGTVSYQDVYHESSSVLQHGYKLLADHHDSEDEEQHIHIPAHLSTLGLAQCFQPS